MTTSVMFDANGQPITSAMASSDPLVFADSYANELVKPITSTSTKEFLNKSTTDNTMYAPFKSADLKQGFESGIKSATGESGGILGFDSFGDLLKDKNMLGNISGLAGTLMQAVALPSMLENARLQNKSLKFNLDTAKQEQARRNKNISGFNSHKTSAFM